MALELVQQLFSGLQPITLVVTGETFTLATFGNKVGAKLNLLKGRFFQSRPFTPKKRLRSNLRGARRLLQHYSPSDGRHSLRRGFGR